MDQRSLNTIKNQATYNCVWEGALIRTRALAVLGVAIAGAFLWPAAMRSAEKVASTATANNPTFDQHSVWQTWKLYCDTCHLGPKARAGVNLEALDLANLDNDGAVWEKVLRKLRNRE